MLKLRSWETDDSTSRSWFEKPSSDTTSFESSNQQKRGWATLTLRVIRGLGTKSFALDDLYRREDQFAEAYPGNRNIRAKIRQQLQVLRDLGFVAFRGYGTYTDLTRRWIASRRSHEAAIHAD
jgi:hypothetical protein